MARPWFALTLCLMAFGPATGEAEPKPPVRGIFVKPERVTPEFLGVEGQGGNGRRRAARRGDEGAMAGDGRPSSGRG